MLLLTSRALEYYFIDPSKMMYRETRTSLVKRIPTTMTVPKLTTQLALWLENRYCPQPMIFNRYSTEYLRNVGYKRSENDCCDV